MAAPSVVYIASSTAGGTATLPLVSNLTTAAVGDLAVIVGDGTRASASSISTVVYTGTANDAGFTSIGHVDSGSPSDGKVQIFARILTSADFSGSNLKQYDVNPGAFWTTFRAQIYVFHHANGWEAVTTQTPYTDIAGFTANTNQSVTASSSRPNVAVIGWGNTSAQNTLTVKWDAGTAREPYCGNSTAGTTTTGGHTSHYLTGDGRAQSDYNEYDTGTGPSTFQLNVGASASHGVVIGFFQTTNQTITGTATLAGGGTLAATGIPTVLGTNVRLIGGGTLAANGVPKVNGTATLAGGGTLHGAQQGATQGTATLSGGGTLSARQAIRGTAVLAGTVTLTATGIRTVVGSAVLSGAGVLTGTGIVGEIPQASSGTWHSGAAYLQTQTWTNATAHLTGGGTLAGTGQKLTIHAGVAALRGNGTLAATGKPTVIGVAALDGGGILHAAGSPLHGHRATLDQDTNGTLDQNTRATLARA